MTWCVRFARCLLTISVLQVKTQISEKSCACMKKLLVPLELFPLFIIWIKEAKDGKMTLL